MIGDRCGRQAADPEERVDLLVFDRVDRFGNTEPLARHVLVAIQPCRLDHAECHHFGRAARRAGRNALALEVAHLVDARALDRDHVHAVRVQDHQRSERHLVALKLLLALVGIQRRVSHRKPDIRLAAADQLQVVDRTAGDFGGGLHTRNVLGKHVGDAAAHGVINAAGATGADRNVLRMAPAGQCTQEWPRTRPVGTVS